MNLNVQSVNFAYEANTPVLYDIGFQIDPNQIVALVGPNGSGKSTLIKLIADLLHLRQGSILVAGETNGSRAAKMSSLYLASNDYLPDFLTGAEYVGFVASLYSTHVSDAESARLFERYQMTGRERDLIEDYSHGMRKKLQLVTALLLKRDLTVIDETLNGIDLDAAYAFEADVTALATEGRSVLLCSHDFAMLQRVSQRLLFLAHGFLVTDEPMASIIDEDGSIDDLVRSYLMEQG